jgi:phosphoenolpyruvate carboxylase
MPQVSRAMSTQHPDNVSTPFFCDSEIISGESEIKEAYYVWSHLGCAEQMWDYEGKEVDNFVIEKLIARYPKFFSENCLGNDIFLTIRVPNPTVQKGQGKILLETLESIPRNYDLASVLGNGCTPIWEVILPMTSSAAEVERVRQYYEKVVVGKSSISLGDTTVSEWIGKILPESISMIPLVEDKESLLSAHKIVGDYMRGKKLEYQRVFLARSDPALNYGSVSAVLLVKMALENLHALQEKESVEIFPIIGVGSAPFRGNLKPTNISNCLTEYPSVQTFTIQSSFKYDYPEKIVRDAIAELNESKRKRPLHVSVDSAERIITKTTDAYQNDVQLLSKTISKLAKYVPQKRARKQHIGLFGYSRTLGGISLPRAIPFCAALYSIGLPPELLGLEALSEKDLDDLRCIYVELDEDISDSTRYLNMKNLEKLPGGFAKKMQPALAHFEVKEDEEYNAVTSQIMDDLLSENYAPLPELVMKAAWMRNFLG